MYFSSPTYLWALLGLVIPIAIHLWSKKEGRTIKVGSTQLLQASDSTKSSSIRLNEWWLLLLRMLLITLIVFILAEPHLKQRENQIPLAYVVEPSLLQDESLRNVLDSVETTAPTYLFMKGLPLFTNQDELPTSIELESPNYWQLAQRLPSIPADSILVFTKATMRGIKGMRPNIPSHIHFVMVPSEMDKKTPFLAKNLEGELEIIASEASNNNTLFYRSTLSEGESKVNIHAANDSITLRGERDVNTIPMQVQEPLQVAVYYNAQFEQDKNYIVAALEAISAYNDLKLSYAVFEDGENLSEDTDWTIWLSERPIPEQLGKVLQFSEQPAKRGIISKETNANLYSITSRLNSENIVEAHFPEALFELLTRNIHFDSMLATQNRSVMDMRQFTPNATSVVQDKKETHSANVAHWFWLVLIPVIACERLLSKYRKQ